MPPSTPASSPTCDHCGYDLRGIAPEDIAYPHIAKCPECGKRSDIRYLPPPHAPWWRFPLAVVAGTATLAASYFVLASYLWASQGRLSQQGSVVALLLSLPIFIGGATSLAIVWRDRLGYLRWSETHQNASVRGRWTLLVDYFAYCLVNSLVAGGVALLLEFAFG